MGGGGQKSIPNEHRAKIHPKWTCYSHLAQIFRVLALVGVKICLKLSSFFNDKKTPRILKPTNAKTAPKEVIDYMVKEADVVIQALSD